jgi:Fe2+ or Zn2+ uptake regulation protein
MVYEKKCDNCGKVLDFGGRESLAREPKEAMKFDDKLYCRECIKKFVEFGTDKIEKRIKKLEDKMDDVGYEMGMEFADP